tara:strand:- start:1626 stop:2003 length:378 start_codon:yes stop_codon:yes gene_type:complete
MSSNLIKFLYATYRGRIGRQTFWLYFILPMFLFSIAIESSKEFYIGNSLFGTAALVLNLLVLVTAFAGFAKRLHDRGKSAWWFLLCLIPVIGTIYWVIDLGILKGEETENEYGAPAPQQLEFHKG